MEPRVAPANRSPREEIISATRPRVKTDRLREKKEVAPLNNQLTP
jgi:hypothetical protein